MKQVFSLCVWIFCGVLCLLGFFPFYKSTIYFNRNGVQLGWMLSPENSNSLEVCAGHRFKQQGFYEETGHKQQNFPD